LLLVIFPVIMKRSDPDRLTVFNINNTFATSSE